MLEPRFQDLLRRASQKSDGTFDATMFERCAACHDPLTATAQGSSKDNAAHQLTLAPAAAEAIGSEHGIGCESCHGPARRWLSRHYQQDVSRDELSELGWTETKNLGVRAKLCAGCHVGSANQDVNHDMIAAGHPPLRFEHASYEALLGRKHWDDRPRRAERPDYEVELWAAGRLAAASAALELLEARARRSVKANGAQPAPWPELAEYNCLACHQPLRSPAAALPLTASSERRGGVPAWQSWNFALVASVVDGRRMDDGPVFATPFDERLGRLRSAMEGSHLPAADEIAHLAKQLRNTLGDRPPNITRDSLNAQVRAPRPLGWDEACQELAALIAASRATHDHPTTAELVSFEAPAAALRFRQPGTQWPAVFATAVSAEPPQAISLADVERQLDELRERLRNQ
jgi:hypothetical protein